MKCISFYAGNVSILFNFIFPFLSSIFNFVNILVKNNLKKQDWWHQSNNYVVFRKPTQVFYSASSRKNIPQGLNRAHQILIKSGFLTNKLRVASYGLLFIYELQVSVYCASYELLFTYELRVITYCTSFDVIFKYDLRVIIYYCASYELNLSYE